jgi:hypothetical protein
MVRTVGRGFTYIVASPIKARVRFPAVQMFLFSTVSRLVLGAHPASYPMGTRGKAAGE